MTVEIFVFCGRWFSNQFDIASETHFNCDSVGRELWLAILKSLLCPEMDRNIRIRKHGYVLILLILRSHVLMFLTSISVSRVVLTLQKVDFFVYWVCQMDYRFTKTNFVRGLVSLDCRLRLLENVFWIIFWKKRLYLSSSGFSCSMPWQDFLCLIFCPVTYNIILILKLSAISKKQREKLCNDDVNRASNRS